MAAMVRATLFLCLFVVVVVINIELSGSCIDLQEEMKQGGEDTKRW